MADDESSFIAGTTADNAVAESEVENGIAGAPIVTNVRERSKGVSWDVELHGMGKSNVADEPKVLCCIKDETDPDWKRSSSSINLPQSTSIGVLYSEVSKIVKYVEGTFLLVWEKITGEEEILGENSSATLYEMQMATHPAKTKLMVRQKDGVQPQPLEEDTEKDTEKNTAGSSSLITTASASSTTWSGSTYSSSNYWSGGYSNYYFGKSDTGFVGLVNQAMTCYLNSLLQTLYMTPEFRNTLYRWKYSEICNKENCPHVGAKEKCSHVARKDKCIPYQLQRLFLQLQTVDKRAVETTDVTKSFGWDSSEAWQQHDVQELCRVMFDALEKLFKNDKETDNDLINKLYQGELQDYVKCLEKSFTSSLDYILSAVHSMSGFLVQSIPMNSLLHASNRINTKLKCSNESARTDSFLDIPLVIKPFGSDIAYKSVIESLKAFVQPETLEEDNQYHCENCGKKCNAHKGLKFTKFPYLLMLQLKRFDFDYNTMHRIKLNDRMTFPKILDLNCFIGDLHHQTSTTEDSAVDGENNDGITDDSSGGVAAGVNTPRSHDDNSDTIPTKEHSSNNTVPGVGSGSIASSGLQCSSDNDEHPVTPPPSYSEAISQPPEASDLSNEDDGLNNKDASSATNPLWYHEGPSSSNKVDDELSEEGTIVSALKNGKYVYELFSIMIHSGSAIGGHYYAYIKSFTDKRWYCFNDQSVTTATDEDIERSFGGSESGSRGYYSSMYASSANAYMLVYRMVNSERNTDFIKNDEFPKHLIEQLELEKEREKREKEREELEKAMCKLTLHSIHPERKIHIQESFAVHKDKSLREATQEAHKLLKYDEVVPVEQCRLVKYDEYNETMEQSFDGQENRPFSLVVGGIRQYYNFDLFLEVRGKDEQFRVYKPGGVSVKVLVVDLESDQVLPPVTVRGEQDWTVAELKKFLKSEFKLKGDVIRIVLEKYYTDLKPLENDDNTLKSEMFYRTSKVYLECSPSDDHKLTFEKSQMYKLIDKHMNSIVLIISYPAMVQTSVNSKEAVESQDTKSSNGMKMIEKTKVLTIDKRTTVSEVKKMLEPCMKLTSNQFKLYRVYSNNQEFEMTRPTDSFSNIPSETKFSVRLGRALNPGEYRIKLYLLRMREIEFSKFLVESVCAKGSTVLEFKKQILEDMIDQKVDEAKEMTVNRMRIRKKMWRSPATIFLDHMIIDKDVQVYTNCEMYIEMLKGDEVMTMPSQMQVYIKRWRPSTYTVDTYDEVILTDATPKHLKQQIAEKAGFPAERVEFAKGIGSFPCDVSPLEIQEDLDWNPRITSINAWPLSLYDDGGVLYYRDSQEPLGELTPERKAQIQKEDNARLSRMNISTGSSSSKYYRKEKALKIYTADDDYKTTASDDVS